MTPQHETLQSKPTPTPHPDPVSVPVPEPEADPSGAVKPETAVTLMVVVLWFPLVAALLMGIVTLVMMIVG